MLLLSQKPCPEAFKVIADNYVLDDHCRIRTLGIVLCQLFGGEPLLTAFQVVDLNE